MWGGEGGERGKSVREMPVCRGVQARRGGSHWQGLAIVVPPADTTIHPLRQIVTIGFYCRAEAKEHRTGHRSAPFQGSSLIRNTHPPRITICP